MILRSHSNLRDRHAYLSASKHHWLGYDEDKFDRVFMAGLAAKRGSELHALAHDLIRLHVKLPNDNRTLNAYVNDAISFRMSPEQILYVSDNCFGTADALSFRNGRLRVHDLKTGTLPASIKQLELYAAMFCMEYDMKPNEIDIELRVYQNDEVQVYVGDPDVIFHHISKIRFFDARIEEMKKEALL